MIRTSRYEADSLILRRRESCSSGRPTQAGCREVRWSRLCRTANTSTALDQFHDGAVALAIMKAKKSALLITFTVSVQRRRSAHNGRHRAAEHRSDMKIMMIIDALTPSDC
jgi:hypothetical protein